MKEKATLLAMGLSVASMLLLSGCGATNGQQNNTGNVAQAGTNSSAQHRSFSNGNGRGGGQLATISKTLGIDTTTMMNDLKGGKSMAEIAAAKGISQQKLISDLESDYKMGLDHMVSSGRISSSQEQQMISKYDSSLPNLIQQKDINAWMPKRHNSTNNNTNSNS